MAAKRFAGLSRNYKDWAKGEREYSAFIDFYITTIPPIRNR